MSAARPLSFLVLTEDTAKDARETLATLVKKLLRHIDHACDTQPSKLRFEPPDRDVEAVAHRNDWLNPRHRDLVKLRQYIATKLTEENGFVVCHVDGDRPYTEHAASEKVAKFEAIIRAHVRAILEAPPQRRPGSRAQPTATPRASTAPLSKLFRISPFYCIEAWLYQNTTTAARLCRQNPACGGKCIDKLEQWQADRKALDEIPQPWKNQICLGKRHNAELAGAGFPTEAIVGAGKSLHDAVKPMRECAHLVRALAQTHSTPPS